MVLPVVNAVAFTIRVRFSFRWWVAGNRTPRQRGATEFQRIQCSQRGA